MKFLIDMNLQPSWIGIIEGAGWEAVHWSQVGYPKAHDVEIMMWAKQNGFIIITLDLDFGEILALTNATGPSVVQLRARHAIETTKLAPYVLNTIRQFATELHQGAIISIDFETSRVKLLPFTAIQ